MDQESRIEFYIFIFLLFLFISSIFKNKFERYAKQVLANKDLTSLNLGKEDNSIFMPHPNKYYEGIFEENYNELTGMSPEKLWIELKSSVGKQ